MKIVVACYGEEMLRTTLCGTFAVVALSMGCSNSESIDRTGQADEAPTPPANESVVTTAAGGRLTGPAVRVEIDRPDAEKPPTAIVLVVHAEDSSGKSVLVHAEADPQFLSSGTFDAVLRSEGGALQPGQARVLLGHKGATTPSAPAAAGSLQVNLVGAELRGEVSGAGPDFDLHFAGPVLVVCSTLLPVANAPVPKDPSLGPGSTVDSQFKSPACSPYASWGR